MPSPNGPDYAFTALARWAADLGPDDVPSPVLAQAAACVLDTVGVALAASSDRGVHRLIAAQRELDAGDAARVWVSGERFSLAGAAKVNGFAASTPELADNVAVHTDEATIPLALAFADAHGFDGRAVLCAIVAGDEVAKRVHDSYFSTKKPQRDFPIGNASVLGTIGSAVTAARLRGADAREMFEAINVAWNLIASALDVTVTSGAPLKPLLFSGQAIESGHAAAVYASHELTAAPDSFENDGSGWLPMTAESWDLDELTRDLGRRWVLELPDRKRHASCGFSHAPLDGVREVVARDGLRPEDVADIRIRVFPFAYQSIKGHPGEPLTPTAAKFDISYLVATALLSGEVIAMADTGEDRIAAHLADPAHGALRAKVHVEPDEAMGLDQRFSAAVGVVTVDGERHEVFVEHARGKGTNQLTPAELSDKFRTLAVPVLGAERADRIVAAAGELAVLPDARRFVDLLVR